MVKCANCGCMNVKGSKECSNCKCILLRGGIAFQPSSFSRKDKFAVTMGGLLFLVVGLFILGRFLFSFEYIISPVNSISILMTLILFLFTVLSPCFLCFSVVYFLYFCVKNGKNKEDISNNIDDNKPL